MFWLLGASLAFADIPRHFKTPTPVNFQLYVGANPLPDNYGQTTLTPITQDDLDQQQRLNFLTADSMLLVSMATGTEADLPEILAAEGAGAGLKLAYRDDDALIDDLAR